MSPNVDIFFQNIVDGVHLAQHPTFAFSDSEEPESEDNQSNNENKDLEKKEEPMEINTTPIYSSHHFPRAKYRYSQNPSSPNQVIYLILNIIQ